MQNTKKQREERWNWWEREGKKADSTKGKWKDARAIITAKCCIFIGAIKLIAHRKQRKQKKTERLKDWKTETDNRQQTDRQTDNRERESETSGVG